MYKGKVSLCYGLFDVLLQTDVNELLLCPGCGSEHLPQRPLQIVHHPHPHLRLAHLHHPRHVLLTRRHHCLLLCIISVNMIKYLFSACDVINKIST